MRHSGRNVNDLREVKFTLDYTIHAEGSVLVEFGNTRVLCNATIEERIPAWLRGQGTGWITAEYSMLPRATGTRNMRESVKGKLSGRTMEIQRLIGRSLRAIIDLEKLGERTVYVDCDVIQADGGTRTASITGAFLALKIAINRLIENGIMKKDPIKEHLAAISVGVLNEEAILDLDYIEDSEADVDMNVVMTESGRFVEVQGTGEEATFTKEELMMMLDLAKDGIHQLIEKQKEVIGIE